MTRRIVTTALVGLLAMGGWALAASPATAAVSQADAAPSGKWVCTDKGTQTKNGKTTRIVECTYEK